MTAIAEKTLHCACGAQALVGTPNWIDETWPISGGGRAHVAICPPCRRITLDHQGSDRCDGRCGGGVDRDAAPYGLCLDCQYDAVSESDGFKFGCDGGPDKRPSPVGDPTFFWSCWDLACIQAWAAARHPTCHVRITPGRAV